MTEAAAVLGAAGTLAALLSRSRAPVLAGLAAIAVAELLLARDLLEGGLVDTLASSAGVAVLVLGVPVLAGLAALLVRFPALFLPLVLATAPLRFPFEVGADNRFFVELADGGRLGRLIPLYAVLAGGGLALAWRAGRGEPARPITPLVAVPAGGLLAFMSVSYLWAYDPAATEDRLAFFVLPFAALVAVVGRAPLPPWLPRVLAIEAVALACLFAVIGLVEAGVRELLFYDPKVAVANSYTSYFRVTSLFSDPSIYARHVAAAIALLVALLWLGRIAFLVGAPLVAFLWAGLWFSYSQSAMVALAVAVVAVSFAAADRSLRRFLAAIPVLLVVVGAIGFATLLRDESADRVTSGRTSLVSDTWTVFSNHPLAGVGLASQPAASRDEAGGRRTTRRNVSHTAPLTVAAELGLAGIALYVAFLAGAGRLLWLLRRRDEALALALFAVVAVFFVHSLVYGVFFDDPLLWTALGIGSAALVAAEKRIPSAIPLFRRSKGAPAPAAR
jgi:hypothetical protein